MPIRLPEPGAPSMTTAKSIAARVVAPSSKAVASDQVSVSGDLFDDLFSALPKRPRTSSIVDETVYVSVKPLSQSSGWVLMKAARDDSLPPNSVVPGPSSRSQAAMGLMLAKSVLVHGTVPPKLDRVVLTFPPHLYEEALAQSTNGASSLYDHLTEQEILRQGDQNLDTGYLVRLCEPVEQGLVARDHTKVTIVREDEYSAEDQASSVATELMESNMEEMEREISKFLTFDDKSDRTEVDLGVEVLSKQVSLSELVPPPSSAVDPETIALVKVDELARIGCFSGDAVVANGTRHLRLYSLPEPNTLSTGAIYVSPLLYYNMGEPAELKLKAIELGGLETADEVTISRLASPVTTDRSLQPAFLSGLRTYFESFRRTVKNGDTIAVPVDTILAQTLYTPGTTNDDLDGGVLPCGKPNDVAWFKITSLKGADGSDDAECIIDPNHTRMVQSGLVTGKHVPTGLGWREYLSLNKTYPTLDLDDARSLDFEHAKKLKQLLTASLSPKGISLYTTILVHSSKRGTGKTTLLKSVAGQMGIHCFEIDCYQLIGESDAKTIGALKARLDRATTISPCLVLLRHIDAIARKSEQDGGDGGIIAHLVDTFDSYSTKNAFIVSATASDIDKMSESIRSKFKFEVIVPVPSEAERRKIFAYLAKDLGNTQLTQQNVEYRFGLRSDVALSNLALQSAGLTPPDLISIIEMAKVASLERLSKVDSTSLDDLVLGSGGTIKLSPEDMEASIGQARTKYSDSIGAPRIPNVGWEDVGGLEGVKKEILDTIEMPLKYPKLFSGGMKKRSGILFYGPPGTGKTLLAKAIATTFSLNFFSVKGPELLNMYIGESEANVRKVFQKARDAKPCVVFFDELDSVAPKRGNQGDSGGVMDRIVSQLLAELDGMSGSGGEGVFVVGATNRPDLLDEALLRPGRFDKMLYLGLSDTHDKQRTILEALTRKFKLASDVSLREVSERCPFTYTGADFYAMSSDAMLNAMIRTAGEVDEKIKAYNEKRDMPISTRWWFQNVATEEDTGVEVTKADFDKALRELIPSVSAEELQHYLRVRANFEGGKEKQPAKPVENVESVATVQNGSVPNGSAPPPEVKPAKKKNKGKQKMAY